MTLTREEFMETVMRTPDMPDELSTTLRKNPEAPTDVGPSKEAFETIGYQLHDFMLGRTYAYMQREGHGPKSIRAELRLVWDDDRSDGDLRRSEINPWFALDDTGTTLLTPDGAHRANAFLTKRSEGGGS